MFTFHLTGNLKYMADDLRRQKEKLTSATHVAVCGLSCRAPWNWNWCGKNRIGRSSASTEELIVYVYLA